MPLSAYTSLIINPGTEFTLDLTWEIDDVGVDLTGYAGAFKVRRMNVAESAVIVEANDSPSVTQGTITLSAVGEINVTIPPALTRNLRQGWNYFDLMLTPPGGSPFVKLAGSMFIGFSVSADEPEES